MTPNKARPRGRWYRGWTIVFVLVLGQIAVNGVPINGFSLFLKSWAADLHSPISRLQLAFLPLAFMTALTAPVIGSLADRKPARWLIGGGVVAMGLFHLGVSSVNSAWQLLLLYGFFLPVAMSLSTSVVANALVSRWFVRRLGLALGLTSFGVGFGGIVLPPIIAAVMATIGWRGIWRIEGAILILVVAPALFLILRDRPTPDEGEWYLAGATGDASGGHQMAGSLAWRDFLTNRNYWLLIGAFLACLATFSGCAYNLAPIAASRGFSPHATALLISVLGTAQVASNLICGFLSDRMGNRIPLVALSLLTAVGTFLIGTSATPAILFVGVAMVGLSGGIWPLVTTAFALEFGSANVGRAFGLMMFVLPINALASVIVAKAEEATGSYTAVLNGFSAFAAIGGILAMAIRERSRMSPNAGS